MRYVFEFALLPYEFSILEVTGVTPKPTGVQVSIFQRATPTFGFNEAGDAFPFNVGSFLGNGVINVI